MEAFEQVDGPDESTGEETTNPEPHTATNASPVNRLFSGEATGPTVQEVQTDYGLDWHWSTAIRGCCRVGTGSGVPPIAEILLGLVAGIYQLQDDELPSGPSQDSVDEADGATPPHIDG